MEDNLFSPVTAGTLEHYIEVLQHIKSYLTQRSTDVYVGPGYLHLILKDTSLYWYITPYELANTYTMQVLDSVMDRKLNELIQTAEMKKQKQREEQNYSQSSAIRFTSSHHLVEPMYVLRYMENTSGPCSILLAEEGKDYPLLVIDILYMYNSQHGFVPKYGVKTYKQWCDGETIRNTSVSDYARPDDFTTHLLVVDKNTARYLLIRNTQEQKDMMDAFIHQLEREQDAR